MTRTQTSIDANGITYDQIAKLREEAYEHMDCEMVIICDIAQYGDTTLETDEMITDGPGRDGIRDLLSLTPMDARAECARVIADAAAQS